MKRNKPSIFLFRFFLIFSFSSTFVFSQAFPDTSNASLIILLKENISLGLNYLSKTQIKETNLGRSYRGEWQTQMSLKKSFFYLGKKQEADDSNCFSITSIHNSLAHIYLLFPEYDNIPDMLNLSYEKIIAYKKGHRFNFWNLLQPTRKLKRGDVIGSQPFVRRPTNFKLKSKYINNAANIAEDADDTSLGYTAFLLRNKIHQKTNLVDSVHIDRDSLPYIFENYKDMNRKNRHFYNHVVGNDHETGAYLTWLGNEYQFKKWRACKMWWHNATMFLPRSQCYPHPYKPNIPYGSNDLDAVINANILSTLALYGKLNSSGVDSAIKFIERKSKLNKYYLVGMYYPNSYQFPYAVANAYASGAYKLENSVNYILKYVIETQNADGSWCSRKKVNNKDVLQSTAYALNTLIDAGNFERNETEKPIKKAIQYLLNNSIRDNDGIHWKGGVFFSGGTIVRNRLIWKSDAYTTALILKAFANYRNYLDKNDKAI